MDKAKAYDEALERARQDRDAYQKELDKTDKNSQLASILKAGITAIEMVFPILKDSDDERIRKQLVDIVAFIPEANFKSASREDCRTYLEKQKEQKSVEWNQKDEKIIKTIIDVLERSSQVTTYEQRGGTMSASVGYSNKYKEEIDWLKNISLNHKKFTEAVDKLWSNEWSDEDEKDIAHIIEILDDCYASGRHDLSKTNHENLVNKLKSLPMRCPKSSDNWKPSEEQIEALDKALYYVPKEIGIPIAKMYRHFNKMKKKLM